MKSRISLTISIILLAKLIFLVLCDPSPSPAEIRKEFEKFKEKNDRWYDSKFDEYKARKNFGKCLKMVNEHNEKYKNGEVSFKLEVNKFADQDPQRIKEVTTNNAPPNPSTILRAIGVINETRFPPGPPFVDWRPTGCITPPKDQSYYCNSCYAFSAVAALEAHWCMKTGNYVSLSEQQLVDCTFNAVSGNWGCAGGSQATSYVRIQQGGGIESDATYPYVEFEPDPPRRPCLFDSKRAIATTSGYWRIRPFKEKELANIIAVVGPVSAAMSGSVPTFWYYSSGVYSDPACKPSTSHSVLIVGYGTDYTYDPPMDYWLCKNSW